VKLLENRVWRTLIALGIAVLAVPGQAQTASSDGKSFTIGSVLDPNINLPLLVAEQQGFFEKFRVSATVKLFPSGAEIVQAIAGGSIDFGATGGVPATILAGKGTDVKVIARVSDISYELALATTKSTGIQKPQDVRGKTVSMTSGTVSQYLVLAFAKHWGVPLDSFTRVNLGPADQLNALAGGSVQMVSVWEPFTSRVRDSGGVILQTALQSHWPGAEGKVRLVGDPGIIFARGSYLNASPDTVRNLLRALEGATKWIQDNPEGAAEIGAKALKTPSASILALIRTKNIYFNFDQDLVDELTEETAFLQEQGILAKTFAAKDWLAPQYMRDVFPQLVTYKGP
jgi:ABC-type nitrate/sulfonate/bicarbonate transport system substrate-binding protein